MPSMIPARRAWLLIAAAMGCLAAQDAPHPLAELDPSFTDNQVLLADTANGKPLFGAPGRFRLVAAKDKSGSRSVRMLTRLEVVQLRK